MPDIPQCKFLDGSSRSLHEMMKGRMFLLGVSSRASGLHQLRTWHADLTQRIGSTHIGQLYLCDGRGFVFFSPFIVNGLKKELPVSMQPQSCLTFSPADGWRKEVGTPHRLMGYWLLCDGKGKIRWQSCGKWSEEGGEALAAAWQAVKVQSVG
jgi:hypothetical protein